LTKAKEVLLLTRELYDAGYLEGAAQARRGLLKSELRQTKALYLLGMIADQTGNQPLAAGACAARLQSLPNTPIAGIFWTLLS
jgi:hypothetical protein